MKNYLDGMFLPKPGAKFKQKRDSLLFSQNSCQFPIHPKIRHTSKVDLRKGLSK